MHVVARVASVMLATALILPPLSATADQSICAVDRFTDFDELSGIWSPCITPRKALVAQATYLQNASAVGGTALAAYPMLDVRTGILPNLEFAFHTPSQIAESGPRGIGLYPSTHLGYGLRYGAISSARFALAAVTDILPAMSRFSPNETQPRYVFGFSSVYAVNAKLLLGFASSATSSGKVGFEQILPSQALTSAYMFRPGTQISTDIGNRFPGRRSPQNFGDIAVNQSLGKTMTFKVGVGTTFNTAMQSKAHYLASGFNLNI
jgi:hypothetical protein